MPPDNRLLKRSSFSTATLERHQERQEDFLFWTGIRAGAYRFLLSILAVLLSAQGKRC
jgi:hypothetical protein